MLRRIKANGQTFKEEAFEFLKGLERKHYEKILYNIRKAQTEHDPDFDLFKNLNNMHNILRKHVNSKRTELPRSQSKKELRLATK